jgi:hypothetical protein
VEEVSWRRDSAEERFAIEVARSRRRRAVEVSTSSRSGSVRFVCGVAGVAFLGLVFGFKLRRWGCVVER